jgi:hypothetical protein
MGRPKNFSREEVLEKAMPVFWKHGFSDTSLQDLEGATGVNKSGLYTEFRDKEDHTEFRDKEDLFVACLRHYIESQEKRGLLTKEPLGWNNVEAFLKNGPLNKGELPSSSRKISSSHGGLPARLLDQATDLDQQFSGGSALPIQICLRHPYPFTMFIQSSLPRGSWIKGYRWSGGELSGSCVRVSPGTYVGRRNHPAVGVAQ